MTQEFIFTKHVDSHHTNPDYRCLLVNLLPLPEFHYRINGKGVLVKADLMPTYEWMMRLVQKMVDWKPEYKAMLNSAVVMGDFERGEYR